MKRKERTHHDKVPTAPARDQVDKVVRKILKALRQRKPVKLPGAGRLVSNAKSAKEK
ncbi:MAG: hypothetical protein M3O20_08415 [Acidobacteriota bacterium]|nr:hypothetical protein [Acidobacteriota bacterium]